MIPAMMSRKTPTQARTTPVKSRSPQTPPREGLRSARGRGSPSAAPPPLRPLGFISAGGQERLPLIRDLADLRLDLFDDGRRQRRVEQVGRILLPVVSRP